MTVETVYPHIAKPAGQAAHLERNPRTRVAMVVMDYLGHGWSADEINRQYPHLTLAEIHAALGYYFDHVEEIEQEIEAECKSLERLANKGTHALLREKLRTLRRNNGRSALS